MPLGLGAVGVATRSVALLTLAACLLLAALLFYRGVCAPPRPGYVTSPCEGKVVEVNLDDHSLHVAVFLGLHNVHAQYAPLDGTVASIRHVPGTFYPAYAFQKSRYNERMVTRLDTALGPVVMVQYAGQLARRIVAFRRPGDRVSQGQPLGLIKFGSRVDLWVPRDAVGNVLVRPGDRVRVGDALATIRDR